MTENEAKKNLETLERFYRIAKSGSALHEVLINFVTLEDLVVAIKALEEIQQYRAIGTVEEFKALKEKNEPKKPIYSDFDNNGYDEIIPYKAICPICGNEFEFESWNEEENHHCICGQKLDWE